MAESAIALVGWPALRRHPNFRAAVERNAAGIVAQKDRLDPIARWLTNDVGRVTILTRALMAEARAGPVAVSDLLAATRKGRWASEGRKLQVLQRAAAIGWLRAEPDTGGWYGRRLQVLPPLMDAWRERAAIEIDAAALVAPEVRPALELIGEKAFFRDFLAHLARFDGMAAGVRGPANPAIRFFLEREAGLHMLYDLIGRQGCDRRLLLEGAALSRSRLSQRFKVSRSHVTRLFAAAAEAGYVALPSRNTVAFSETMNEEAERHFALTFHVIAASARAALEEAAPSFAKASEGRP